MNKEVYKGFLFSKINEYMCVVLELVANHTTLDYYWPSKSRPKLGMSLLGKYFSKKKVCYLRLLTHFSFLPLDSICMVHI
jgi:hypothetical protein